MGAWTLQASGRQTDFQGQWENVAPNSRLGQISERALCSSYPIIFSFCLRLAILALGIQRLCASRYVYKYESDSMPVQCQGLFSHWAELRDCVYRKKDSQ